MQHYSGGLSAFLLFVCIFFSIQRGILTRFRSRRFVSCRLSTEMRTLYCLHFQESIFVFCLAYLDGRLDGCCGTTRKMFSLLGLG